MAWRRLYTRTLTRFLLEKEHVAPVTVLRSAVTAKSPLPATSTAYSNHQWRVSEKGNEDKTKNAQGAVLIVGASRI